MSVHKNLFVVGDIHGCYHTFLTLLQHWQPQHEQLIQVGDLIDRGNFSPQVVALARTLARDYKAVFLRGNHEHHLIRYAMGSPSIAWLQGEGIQTLEQYAQMQTSWTDDASWMHSCPLYWESRSIFISHAGISPHAGEQTSLDSPHSIIKARGELRHIGKVQVVGHTPQRSGKPAFREHSATWYIDTAAVYGKKLTALRIQPDTGTVMESISVPTIKQDIPPIRMLG